MDKYKEAIEECKGYNSWGALDESVIEDVASKLGVDVIKLKKEFDYE